ncbi:retrovirus-related pol polyprotein from transposon TNT 1-94, partial [Tanacetum coccineum]
MLRPVPLEGRPIVVLGLREGLLGANPIPHHPTVGQALLPQLVKGHFQNQCSKLVASRDKEVNMAARYSDDALVCCVKNTVEDRIMDSGALFHATYCTEELERSMIRSDKVRLVNDKTLEIASVRDVLDEEGYHVGFRDQQWKVTKGSLVVARENKCGSLYMVEVHPEGIGAIIDDVRKVDIYFCKPDGLGKQKKLSFIMSEKTRKLQSRSCGRYNANLQVQYLKFEMIEPNIQSREHGASCRGSKDVMRRFSKYGLLNIPHTLRSSRFAYSEEEWRGKDTSLARLKVFGCNSFVKVKDVYEEAMKCTFIGSGSDEMQYSFRDTKSHQVIQSKDITFVDSIYGARLRAEVGAQIRVRGSKTIGASRIVEHQIKNTLKTEHPAKREAPRLYKYEDPPEKPDVFLSQITSRKEGITKLVDFDCVVCTRSDGVSWHRYAVSSLMDTAYRMLEHAAGQNFDNVDDIPTNSLMPDLEDTTGLLNTGIFSGAYDDEDEDAEADLNNLETTMNVDPIPTTRIHKDHPKDQIIGDINSATQTRRMTKISEEHAMVSYINKQRRTNHNDYQNYLFACFLSQKEPKKVIQALDDPSWIEAMQEELLQFRLQK